MPNAWNHKIASYTPRFGGSALSVLEFPAEIGQVVRLQPQLTSADRRALKGKAQHLEPVLKVGHSGVSEAFLASVGHELALHQLIKVKFVAFKDQRRELASQIAASSESALVQVVGHVAVFYKPKPSDHGT